MNPEEQEVELEKTRKDLKIQALRERIAQLDDENSDYRVNLTILSQQNQELVKALEELKGTNVSEDTEEVPVITDAE